MPAYACRVRGDAASWRKVLSMAGFGNSGMPARMLTDAQARAASHRVASHRVVSHCHSRCSIVKCSIVSVAMVVHAHRRAGTRIAILTQP